MKTKSRKRLLISSVAMLLVAMLALGTATFAWFTQNTSATADKLSVQTVKASELQISKNDGAWDDQIHYDYVGKVLKPASSVDGSNWFTATAAAKDSFDAAAVNATDISSKLDGYVFKNQINVRNNGSAAVEKVKIKFNLNERQGGGDGNYVRLAIVPADKLGTEAKVTAADFKNGVFASAADTADALKNAAKETEVVKAKSGADGEVEVGTLTAKGTAGAVKYYNLYVWFEGQDTDCFDYNGGNVMPEVTFRVTGDTVNQQTGN